MKYIIDIPDEVPVSDELVPFDMCRPSWYLEAYEKGKAETEDEVWEFVRIITDMTEKQRIECFGGKSCDLDEYWTYQDAKAKYEAWKEFRVGDEVELELSDGAKGLVYIVGEEMLEGAYLNCDGLVPFCWRKEDCRKTGKHFDEIAELLKKMRDTE